MKSADKIPVSLYQLNLSHFSNTEFESVVNQVISVANRKGMQLNEEFNQSPRQMRKNIGSKGFPKIHES